MAGQIHPTELELNKANSSDAEALFLDLNLTITNGIVSSKIYDKQDDLNVGFSKAVVLMLLTCCLSLLPLWESVIVLCFVVRYFMSSPVLQ